MGKQGQYLQEAEHLFLEGSTLEEIARILPISVTTLSAWKIANCWDEKRDSYRKRPLALQEMIIKQIQLEFEKIGPEGVTKDVADNLSKLAAVLSRLGGVDDFPSSVMMVMKEFGRFIAACDIPDEQKDLVSNLMAQFFEKIKSEKWKK